MVATGSASEKASACKEEKYATLAFITTAIEQWSNRFKSIIIFTGAWSPRESAFLFQRLPITLQRYNAVCIRGTFGAVYNNDSDKAIVVVAYHAPPPV